MKGEDGFWVKVIENPVQKVNGFPLEFQNHTKFMDRVRDHSSPESIMPEIG